MASVAPTATVTSTPPSTFTWRTSDTVGASMSRRRCAASIKMSSKS